MRKAPVAAVLLVALSVTPAHAGPSPAKAWNALVETPLRTTGDLLGAAGLVSASAVALAGDGVALLDATFVPPGPLGGWVSGPVRRVAMALSWTGTGALEAFRGEDIERLPEDPATYTKAAPGRGRLDTFLSGVGAIRLAIRDLLTGPALVTLHLVGAERLAARVEQRNAEARTRLLGPLPVPGTSPNP